MNVRTYFGIAVLAHVAAIVAAAALWLATPVRGQELPPGMEIGGMGALNFGCTSEEDALAAWAVQRGAPAFPNGAETVDCAAFTPPAPSKLAGARFVGDLIVLEVELLGTRKILFAVIARPGEGA
jgi:hypothetical protein